MSIEACNPRKATGTANLAGQLATACELAGWKGNVAYICGERTFTHGEVHEGAARFAGYLASRGITAGDRVLLALRDEISFVWAFLGAIRAGAVAIPVNPGLPAGELTAVTAQLRADVALVDHEEVQAAATTGAGMDAVPCEESTPAYAQMTSGTTGPPKAAVHRHGDPFVYQMAFGLAVLGLQPRETVLSVSKLFFAYGLGNSLFYPLLAGCRAVLVADKPTPASTAALLRSHDVDVLFAVPSFYARLLGGGGSQALRRLRIAISAGEALPHRLHHEFEARTGVRLLDGLGSTEVGQTFASNRLVDARSGTVGRPLPPYSVRIVDEAGRPVAAGKEGLLQVSGPTTLVGYLDGDDSDCYEGEWLRTRDVGFLDADGFLHMRGRADDVEIVGGIKVHPHVIEERLATHPSVLEVAVCAVADADSVARLTAFVVRSPIGPPDASLATELLECARDDRRLSRSVRSIVFMPVLPRTVTGKLMRFRLRQQAAGFASQPRTQPSCSSHDSARSSESVASS